MQVGKKIALMTWHHVRNYGTALQAYALKRTIEKMGLSVDLIEYRREYNNSFKYFSLIDLIRGKFNDIRKKTGKIFDFKNELFECFFQKHFTYTVACKYWQDFNVLNKSYDAFVCGSDQIWGPEWFNPVYFLDFVKDENKLVAYAPSIGVSEITDKAIYEDMKRLISRYPSVSIRESSGCRIVEEMGAQKVCNVLDPVLLLSKKEWRSLSDHIDNLPKKYAVVFFLKDNECNIKKCLNRLAERNLVPVIFHSTQGTDNNYANFGGCSVEQLLYLIDHSEIVYTDSFHITVLSIIFEKQFTLFLKNAVGEKNSKNSRLIDFLGEFGLIDNVYDVSKKIDVPINYELVLTKLSQLRDYSIEYLNDQLLRSFEKSGKSSPCYKCSRCEKDCCGEINDSFAYVQNKNSSLSKRMSKWAFALEEKCYTCKYLNRNLFFQSNRPLFYTKLIGDLEKRKSIFFIYVKYFLAYDQSMIRRAFK